MDARGFMAEYPEFSQTDPVLIAAKLAEAARWMDSSANIWGPFGTSSMAATKADDGQKHYAAHLLSQHPFGGATRLEPGKGRTTYLERFEELRDSLGTPTFLVAGW